LLTSQQSINCSSGSPPAVAPKVSLQCSQHSATCRYQPDQSSPRPPSYFSKISFNIILTSAPAVLKVSLSLRFSHQNTVCTLPLSRTCHMSRPSLSRACHMSRPSLSRTCHMSCPSHYCFNYPHNIGTTNHEASHCAASSGRLLLHPSFVQHLCQHMLSNNLSLCF